MSDRSQRDAAIVAAWYTDEPERSIAERFWLSSHSVQGIWIAARRSGLLPSGIKRFTPRWQDLQVGEVLVPPKKPYRPFPNDELSGAPSVGDRDHLLARLQKVHADRRYEDVVHRA